MQWNPLLLKWRHLEALWELARRDLQDVGFSEMSKVQLWGRELASFCVPWGRGEWEFIFAHINNYRKNLWKSVQEKNKFPLGIGKGGKGDWKWGWWEQKWKQDRFYTLNFWREAMQHVGSEFPNQGSNPHPLCWRNSLNHWTIREVLTLIFLTMWSVLVPQLCWLFATPWLAHQGFSVHGILQARILELEAISFYRESSQPRDHTWVLCIASRLFTIWATREALLLFFF